MKINKENVIILESVSSAYDKSSNIVYALNEDGSLNLDSASNFEDIENEDFWESLSNKDRSLLPTMYRKKGLIYKKGTKIKSYLHSEKYYTYKEIEKEIDNAYPTDAERINQMILDSFKSGLFGLTQKEGLRKYWYNKFGETIRESINKREEHEVSILGIESKYPSNNPEIIWNEWTKEQRDHFLLDHAYQINKKEYIKETIYFSLQVKKYSDLPESVKEEIKKHIQEGRYEKGAKIGLTNYEIEVKQGLISDKINSIFKKHGVDSSSFENEDVVDYLKKINNKDDEKKINDLLDEYDKLNEQWNENEGIDDSDIIWNKQHQISDKINSIFKESANIDSSDFNEESIYVYAKKLDNKKDSEKILSLLKEYEKLTKKGEYYNYENIFNELKYCHEHIDFNIKDYGIEILNKENGSSLRITKTELASVLIKCFIEASKSQDITQSINNLIGYLLSKQ